jgi:hypothetical protein
MTCKRCENGMAAYKVALAAFDAKYPHVCRTCGGLGEVVYSEDPGDRHCGLAGGTMELTEPCPDCEGADKPLCAVCGRPIVDLFDQEKYPNGRTCGCDIGIERPQAETYFDPDCPCTMPPVESVAEAIAEDLYDFTEENERG